jgi:di/tricarboxylate transporter
MYFTIGVVVLIILILVLDFAPSDVVFIGALIVLLFVGIISPAEALSGFSNKGMITVGLLFVVSQGVENTGIFQRIAEVFLSGRKRLNGKKRSKALLMIKMMIPVTFLSAFLNNTPIVTIFTPVVKRWSVSQNLSAGKFLIPLSYAAIFGGVCTLIGTSTNLIVHGLMLQNGYEGFGFFELAKAGIPIAAAGFIFLAFFGQKLLPDRRDTFTDLGESPKEYFIEMIVPEGSSLKGKTVEQARLRNLQGVYLTDIERGPLHLGPVTPDRRLEVGDRLFFAGRTDAVADVLALPGLIPVDREILDRDARDIRQNLVEVVVSANAPVVGKTIKECSFRSLYDAAVVALSRNGERVNSRLGDVELHPGDTMVLLAKPDFVRRHRFSRDFYLVSDLDRISPEAQKKGPFALVVVLAMVLLAALGDFLPKIGGNSVDMFYAAAGAAFILILGRTIGAAQARDSIRWDVLVTIGAAFGVSKALINSGAAQIISQGVVDLMSPLGGLGALFAVYLATSIFTEIITNNAAAALMFPIAMATAANAGAPAVPFFMAVAMGASASFATPIGYQTNLIVQGAGGYRFKDFLKIGIPMNLISLVAGVAAIAFWYKV